MFTKKTRAVPIFRVNKRFSTREKIIKRLQSVLIFLVIAGTLIWVLVNSGATFKKIGDLTWGKIKPKVETPQKQATVTSEDQIKQLLDEHKTLEVTKVETHENYLKISSKNKVTVYFNSQKDLADQVRALQTLLSKAKIDNRSLKKVDFRFEKIIVEY